MDLPRIKNPEVQAARRKLLRLQNQIYRALQKEADRILGETPPAIRKYQKEFDRDFRSVKTSLPSEASHTDLIQAIRSAEICWVGDFHTFSQAQRTALRLLREAVKPGEEWILGLEMVSSPHQDVLDQLQQGKLSEEAFLKKIEYESSWGFPWENYAPLFRWAIQNQVRIVALNRPRDFLYTSASLRKAGTDTELQARDEWAAGILTDLFSEARVSSRKLRALVLYGELHVARAHLPKQLELVSERFLGQALRSLTVHQNHDQLYWRLAEEGKEHGSQVFQLATHTYCVMASTPWSKLQSLVDWAEGGTSGATTQLKASDQLDFLDHEADEEDEDEVSSDYLSSLQAFGRTLASFFGVQAPSFESLTVKSIDEADFFKALRRSKSLSRTELQIIRHFIETNQRIYIPKVGIAYLATPSLNGIAELAGIHLYRELTGDRDLYSEKQDCLKRLLLVQVFGFLSSMLINPKRKCDLIDDHRREISRLAIPRAQTEVIEKDARRLALRWMEEAPEAFYAELPDYAPVTQMLALQFIGQILGTKLHRALLMGKLTPSELRDMLLSRTSPPEALFESLSDIRLEPSKRLF